MVGNDKELCKRLRIFSLPCYLSTIFGLVGKVGRSWLQRLSRLSLDLHY